MRHLLLIAAAAAILGACDSSGCGGAADKKAPSGESTGMSGGGGARGGGLGEPVSFQGLGKKREAAAAAQSVICGGFANLPSDCSKAPQFEAIKKKCCPAGQVVVCQGIPGGARLTGQGCAAPLK